MTEIYINAIGEHIEIRPDGTRHRVHHEHPLKAKIAAGHEDRKQHHQEMHEKKMRRIESKKAQQRAKGWPADKSPI